MSKKIEDYLHLYIGADVSNNSGDNIKMEPHLLLYGNIEKFKSGQLKLILRPLSDMTEEEDSEVAYMLRDGKSITKFYSVFGEYEFVNGPLVAYLLKQGFDLFGLINSGLALEK